MKESLTKKQTANQTGGKYKKRETEEQKQKKRGKHQGSRKKRKRKPSQPRDSQSPDCYSIHRGQTGKGKAIWE